MSKHRCSECGVPNPSRLCRACGQWYCGECWYSYTQDHCDSCIEWGQSMALNDWDEEDYEFRGDGDDDYHEPTGSCDNCEGDLYEDDCYYSRGFQYCGQCFYLLRMA